MPASTGNGFGDLLVVVAMVLAVVAGAGVVLIGVVMWRYRLPPRALFAMLGALVYLISPLDVLPDELLGPVGLLDDAGVIGLVAVWVHRLIVVRRMLREGGVEPRRRPPSQR